MPGISDRQALIQAVLLQADITHADYLHALATNNDSDDDGDVDDELRDDENITNPDGSTMNSSDSSSTSESSTLLSSSDSEIDSDDSDNMSDDEDEVYAAHMAGFTDLLQIIMETCTINPHEVHKCSQLFLVLVQFKSDDPKRFRQNLRVSPGTFDNLVIRIQDNPVFTNNSHNHQFPVEIQLAIALYRFGHDGNAASVDAIAQWASVSSGLVVKCTVRIIVAFLDLHDSVICWPSDDEKEEAKAWVRSTSCDDWGGGFCMVDGTLVPLFEKPGYHGEGYFDRKSNYSLNIQVSPHRSLRSLCKL
ncbi:hypothetical protein BD779DRAFT_1671316 [Infundibulicybe gibba]|nr:hypothetical protein BD779DRAFT_1671316 [Infundibulicybe gibba]